LGHLVLQKHNNLQIFPTLIYNDYKTDKNIPKRQSRDTRIDQRRKELLDLCISNQLRILNGRVLGDIFGNYTFYNPHKLE
jgi:hypothetical protein